MSPEREKMLLSESKEELVRRIAKLERDMERSLEERNAAYEIAQEALRRRDKADQENTQAKERIKTLTDPHGRHNSGLSWLGKVVHIIRQKGRPLRSNEIMHELEAMDDEGMFDSVEDPDKYLSSVISKGKAAGRLKSFKVAGTRGSYYALEEWVDKEGKLIPEMKAQLL